jgi:hypothetical protein
MAVECVWTELLCKALVVLHIIIGLDRVVEAIPIKHDRLQVLLKLAVEITATVGYLSLGQVRCRHRRNKPQKDLPP